MSFWFITPDEADYDKHIQTLSDYARNETGVNKICVNNFSYHCATNEDGRIDTATFV